MRPSHPLRAVLLAAFVAGAACTSPPPSSPPPSSPPPSSPPLLPLPARGRAGGERSPSAPSPTPAVAAALPAAPGPAPPLFPLPAPELTPPDLPRLEPATDLDEIDDVVKAAIARRDVPGAVVLVVRGGGIVFERAHGLRSKKPQEEPMTVDTVFDLGSLTKVVATAPAILLLAQKEKIALSDRVSRHLPEFGQQGKEGITIAQLLLHTSGLMPDNHLRDYEGGAARALERIYALRPLQTPGTKFDYSDVGYIVLGALVERVTAEPLGDYVRRRIYEPLGMRDTTFSPGEAAAGRVAPTSLRDGRYLRGEVHDPRAARLGGVAGHAGLFATAADLARFAILLLNRGEIGSGRRIFDPATVEQMIAPRELPGGAGKRGLGWDIQTAYSGVRGDLPGGFGHTGFTGTSMWIVPEHKAAVILLSNRVHPDDKGATSRLRRDVARVVARSLAQRSAPWVP